MGARLSDEQDVDVNYYILVPFTTAQAALWAADRIEFDTHVVGRAAVDQDTPLVKEVEAHVYVNDYEESYAEPA
jgi:hypothetical protein